jgi:Zn-dependent peptidase ImmA (M78 family)/transcriptional regulator with XRE-family HTH domain
MKGKILNKFNGDKLKQARLIRNITINDLAAQVGVSHQSISKYEHGLSIPRIEVIQEIASALNFNLSFFYLESIEEDFYEGNFIFRKRAGVAKKYQDQLKENLASVLSFIRFIENRLRLPRFNLELLRNSKRDNESIEILATKVRRSLGLGDGPIDNVTTLCEKLGIVVVFIDLSQSKIDGCSIVYNDRPYIILNNKIDSAVRRRFTLAHELGHILLHSKLEKGHLNNSSANKEIEREANYFASCLLMPESEFTNDINGLGLEYLLVLKPHWKVSLQSMIFRAEQLNIFTEDYALYLRQQISRKKWRTIEPLDDRIPVENPSLLKQAINFLVEKANLSLEQISFHTGFLEKELIQVFQLSDEVENYNATVLSSNNHLKRVK